MRIKLSEWARRNGISYRTAYRMFQRGNLPVSSMQLDTGTILVGENDPHPSGIAEEIAEVKRRLDCIERKLDEVLALV